MESVSIRRFDTPFCAFRHNISRFDTPYYTYNPYLCRENLTSTFNIYIMSITVFFREAPVFATLITLGYLALMGVFVYVIIRMYKK